jgi:hypothetical protein
LVEASKSVDRDRPAAGKTRSPSLTTPAADEPVSFAEHIKPMFRPYDRESMTFAFDLWEVDDVRENADAILERLRDGDMPCDGRWPSGQVALFEQWVATGKRD